jgi:hypothetical protein
MKIFKTDSKGNFKVDIHGIEVETIITMNTPLENDELPVLANNTIKLVLNIFKFILKQARLSLES